ncbi:MAG: KH domain-containing protein [Erysipelotrichia bacterium]|nr:KH domain-containing protein [Erysipelotrichia bacterium]
MNSYSGKTLEEALAAAAAEKNCKPEDLTYFVKEETEEGATVDAYCEDDVKEFLFNYIGTFFTDIDQDIEVGIEEKDESYTVRLNAENNALLIGRMGRTLAALNTVIRGAVNNEFHKHLDVLIDVNDYKEDRYRIVRSIARRTAKEVLNTHVDAALDPMPNDERKAIHRILNTWDHIITESAGEGRDRHIVIKYAENKDDSNDDSKTEETSEAAS